MEMRMRMRKIKKMLINKINIIRAQLIEAKLMMATFTNKIIIILEEIKAWLIFLGVEIRCHLRIGAGLGETD